MVNLFEYKWNNEIPDTLMDEYFENYLDEIWNARLKVENWYFDEFEESETDTNKQQFIRFRAHKLSSRNYVGVIRYKDTEINLLPKIFYKKGYDSSNGLKPTNEEIKNIYLHLLYWLSYSKKIHFPQSLSDLESIEIDNFLEIFILMYATYTRDVLNRYLYQNYHEVNQNTQFIKGRLDVNSYIKKISQLVDGSESPVSMIHLILIITLTELLNTYQNPLGTYE